jgi:hypothetical protein
VFGVLGVRSALRAAGEEVIADKATLAAVLFMALHTLHNLAILSVAQVLASSDVPGTAEATEIEAVARGFLGFAYATFLPGGGVGSLLFIVAMASFAGAQRRSRALAPWSGRLAIASALLIAAGYAQYIVPPAMFIALLGWVAYVAWTVFVSIGLVRRAERRGAVLTQPA